MLKSWKLGALDVENKLGGKLFFERSEVFQPNWVELVFRPTGQRTRIMAFSSIIQQDLKVARSLASWVVALSFFAFWGVVPANADMIYMVESVPAEQFALSIDRSLTTADWLFGGRSSDGVGCSGSATHDEAPNSPASPEIPADQLPSETPFVGVGIPSPSNGAGAGSGSSTGGSGHSVTNAILCWVLKLPQPTLISRLYEAINLDIPPAPTFELLRPPQAFSFA